jgi:hypothetical protein
LERFRAPRFKSMCPSFQVDTSRRPTASVCQPRAGAVSLAGPLHLSFVSSPQQLFCSFDGTAILNRPLGSPVQVCEDRGGVSFIGNQFLSPVGRWTCFRFPAALSIYLRQQETAYGRCWRIESYLRRGIVMKSQRPAQAKNARKPSDAVIARRYLDLQRLRDEVRKAEISFAPKGSKKPWDRNQLTN